MNFKNLSMRNFTLLFFATVLLFLSSLPNDCYAQQAHRSGTYGNNVLTERPNTPIDSSINGFIEVLPVGYATNPTKRYPLLIFLEGQSQFGDGGNDDIIKLYGFNEGMLADIIADNNFPNSYNVGGVTYEFIVIIPQIRSQTRTRPPGQEMASPGEINDIINYAMQNYRVDEDRVYLSGLSIGGGPAWNYPGESVDYANRIAASVPFAGASNLDHNHQRDDNIAASLLPVWTFVTSADTLYKNLAQVYVDSILQHPVHGETLITIYERIAGDHNSWAVPLLGGNTELSGHPANIYMWMLEQSRDLPTAIFADVTTTVNTPTVQLANGSMVLGAHGVGFTGATVTITGSYNYDEPTPPNIVKQEWVRTNGTGGIITNPTASSTTITNLSPGQYSFQYRVTDENGLTSVSSVSFEILKPAENKYLKVEAEDYNTFIATPSRPSVNDRFYDQGPDAGLSGFSANSGATYSVSLPIAGKYALYYRYKSNTVGAQMRIVAGGEDRVVTLASGDVWTTDSVELTFSSTTAAITIVGAPSFSALNYMELALLAAGTALPVNFTSFSANCENGTVSLSWKTAQEQNSHRFSIQKNTAGGWQEIGTLAAAGQSNSERSYHFTEKRILAGNQYRIVEYDLDGKTTISPVVKRSCDLTEELVQIYPNPAHEDVVLNIQLQNAAKLSIWIFDSKGSMIHQRVHSVTAGNSALPLSTSGFPRGVYTVKVQFNQKLQTLKLIKK
jgi:hypothetical protein